MDVRLSIFDQNNSIGDFLRETFGLSRSKIKSFKFKKSFLEKTALKRDEISLPLDLVNNLEIFPEYNGPSIDLIYEDELFLAFNKPSKTHIHPLSYCESDNCLSALRSLGRGGLLNQVNKGSYDRGLLYRLDYETSGVCIFVKREEDYFFLRKNFLKAMEEKVYICIVKGNFSKEGEYTSYFKGVGENSHKVMVCEKNDTDGREGKLSVKKLNYSGDRDLSLLRVQLTSGLRHQIRVQLAYLDYPILGDTLYGGDESERIFLHALKYSLIYQGRTYQFESKRSHEFLAHF